MRCAALSTVLFPSQPECKAVGQLGPAAAAAAAADSGAVCVEVRAGRPPLRGVSKLFVKYDWATIDRAVIHVRESSRCVLAKPLPCVLDVCLRLRSGLPCPEEGRCERQPAQMGG